MDTFIERQGFYDYINHFITGATFAFGIEIMLIPFDFSLLQLLYQNCLVITSLNKDSFLWTLCVILIFGILLFLLGVLIQELYALLYDSEDESGKMKAHRSISRLWRKVSKNYFVAHIFDDCTEPVILNKLKRDSYKKYAGDIAKSRYAMLGKKAEGCKKNPASYFFAYCAYYIQVRNQNKKAEKLRDKMVPLSRPLSQKRS